MGSEKVMIKNKMAVSVFILHPGQHEDSTYCVAVNVVGDQWQSRIIRASLTMDEILEVIENPGGVNRLG